MSTTPNPNDPSVLLVAAGAAMYSCSDGCPGNHLEITIQTESISMTILVKSPAGESAHELHSIVDRFPQIVAGAVAAMVNDKESEVVIRPDGSVEKMQAPDFIPEEWTKKSDPEDPS